MAAVVTGAAIAMIQKRTAGNCLCFLGEDCPSLAPWASIALVAKGRVSFVLEGWFSFMGRFLFALSSWIVECVFIISHAVTDLQALPVARCLPTLRVKTVLHTACIANPSGNVMAVCTRLRFMGLSVFAAAMWNRKAKPQNQDNRAAWRKAKGERRNQSQSPSQSRDAEGQPGRKLLKEDSWDF